MATSDTNKYPIKHSVVTECGSAVARSSFFVSALAAWKYPRANTQIMIPGYVEEVEHSVSWIPPQSVEIHGINYIRALHQHLTELLDQFDAEKVKAELSD